MSPAALHEGEVHLWHADLDAGHWHEIDGGSILSVEEELRAQRFHFDRDRRRFIASHIILRLILARYLDREPHALRYTYGPNGKPALAGFGTGAALRFNLAHSHGMALCAIARNKEVGVDLEYKRHVMDLIGLAKNSFTAREFEILRRAPNERRQDLFFTLWTCKEAYLKATGEGITGLGNIEITVEENNEPSLSPRTSITGSGRRAWTIVNFSPMEGFAAALAVEGCNDPILHQNKFVH